MLEGLSWEQHSRWVSNRRQKQWSSSSFEIPSFVVICIEKKHPKRLKPAIVWFKSKREKRKNLSFIPKRPLSFSKRSHMQHDNDRSAKKVYTEMKEEWSKQKLTLWDTKSLSSHNYSTAAANAMRTYSMGCQPAQGRSTFSRAPLRPVFDRYLKDLLFSTAAVEVIQATQQLFGVWSASPLYFKTCQNIMKREIKSPQR